MKIGNREFSIGKHTYIMGILNMTPDSFSDGGKYRDMDKALFRAGEMISEGAAILDVGGESTRPGAVKISAQEEMERVLPLLERLKDREHKYFACPKCKQSVRVPKGKGKIAITCPKCREKFVKKT